MATFGSGQDERGRGDPGAPADLVARATAGEAEAQSDLGRWYLEHSRHPERVEIGSRWFQAAARQGLPRANHNLGVMAVQADNVEAALPYFLTAAEAGWVPSMMAFGALLEEAGDLEAALPWYERAAEGGEIIAQGQLGKAWVDSDDPAVRAKGMAWLLKAGEAGEVGAQAYLGWVYNEGTVVPRDPAVACMWWRKAAEQGHGGAQSFLGIAHHMGIGVKQDLVEAGFWTLSAARNNVEMGKAYWQRLERDLGPAELAAILARFDQGATRQ